MAFNKNNKKIVTTALTAAMVASAVAPVAAAKVTPLQDATKAVDGYYKLSVKTRADVSNSAKVKKAALAKVAKLTSKKDASAKKALTAKVAKKSAAINKYYKTVIVEKENVAAAEAFLKVAKETPITVKTTKEQVEAAYNQALALIAKINSTSKKAELKASADKIKADALAEIAKLAVAKVSAVTATNTKTLTVTGTGLNKLTAENLSLAGNTIVSVTANAEGTSATVALGSAIVPNQELTLNVTVDGVATSFKFSYGFVVSTVAVNAVTLDDDTKFQSVGFKVNGQDADLDALVAAGYTVEFKAVDKDNADVTSTFFADDKTGDVANSNDIGDYKVQVTVAKGSTVVVSDAVTVKVRNTQGLATAINSYELTKTGAAFVQNSSTLVVGETANVTKINVTANGDKTNIEDPAKYSVKSSAPGVISVNPTTGLISANAPGTATLTISYGDVKKEVTYTVTNTARKLSKVAPAASSVTIIKTADAKTIAVEVLDQYGDLLPTTDVTVVAPGVVSASATSVTSDAEGAADFTLEYAATGSGTVYFKDAKNNTVGSLAVKTTETNTAASKKLEIFKDPTDVTKSADTTLDKNADHTVIYKLNEYTSENAKLGSVDLAGYTVKYNSDVVTVAGDTSKDNTGLVSKTLGAGEELEIAAYAKGSTTVALYNASNILVAQVTITVTSTEYSISKVDFKTVAPVTNIGKVIKGSTALTLVSSAGDDIVNGITLSKSSMHAVRVVEASGATHGLLYVDIDDNGAYDDTKDVALATVTEELATDFVGATPGSVDDIFLSTGGYTTASGHKGSVIYKVVALDGSTILASTTVAVDVK